MSARTFFTGALAGLSLLAGAALHAISASNELAQQRGRAFLGFEKSTYADGSFFEKYVTRDWLPASDRVRDLFAKHGVQLPARADWEALKERVML